MKECTEHYEYLGVCTLPNWDVFLKLYLEAVSYTHLTRATWHYAYAALTSPANVATGRGNSNGTGSRVIKFNRKFIGFLQVVLLQYASFYSSYIFTFKHTSRLN